MERTETVCGWSAAVFVNPRIDEIRIGKENFIDLETTGLNGRKDKVTVLGIHNTSGTYVLEFRNYSREEQENILLLLSKTKLVMHNAKFDMGFIYNYGIECLDVQCTMLLSQMVWNGKKYLNDKRISHGLEGCLERLGIEISKQQQKSFIGFTGSLSQEQIAYVVNDVKHLPELRDTLLAKAKRYSLETVVNLEFQLLPVLVEMEQRGVKVDVDGWNNQIKLWEDELFRIELQLDSILVALSKDNPGLKGGIYTRERKKQKMQQIDIFGNSTAVSNSNAGNINYGSSKQIIEIFDRVGLKPPTEGNKVSVDEGHIKKYLTENSSCLDEFLTVLLRHREYSKLLSTYGDGFLNMIENGRIHTTYSQCMTETGRLSSSSPNLKMRVL
jgi:DNA polymerase I-like protein with 3'-5' exonuclease and polymerase domains